MGMPTKLGISVQKIKRVKLIQLRATCFSFGQEENEEIT